MGWGSLIMKSNRQNPPGTVRDFYALSDDVRSVQG